MVRRSLVEFFGLQVDSQCGYCRGKSGSHQYGFWAHLLTVENYQALIDRGWRRSGRYCYKPILNKSCCPLYTIRCRALDLKLSRSQKRTTKRLNYFLRSGYARKRKDGNFFGQSDRYVQPNLSDNVPSSKLLPVDFSVDRIEKAECSTSREGVVKFQELVKCSKMVDESKLQRKAKYKRRMRKLEKLRAKGIDPKTWVKKCPPVKSLEDFLKLPDDAEQPKHKLQVKLLRSSPPSVEFFDAFEESFNLYKKYQIAIHGDPPDKPTKEQFKRFLCDSPLLAEHVDDSRHPGFGSFHCLYILDGSLIAVGVLDILPRCVSSKYFFYDPDFSFLSLGIYSVLNELQLTRALNKVTPDLRYYCMGYYIHQCPKMRYKAAYLPSDLLCPETMQWFPVGFCKEKLDVNKYCRFADDEVADELQESSDDINVDDVSILLHNAGGSFSQGKWLDFRARCPNYQAQEKNLKLLSKLVGHEVIKNLVVAL